jgi:hypothetical protein
MTTADEGVKLAARTAIVANAIIFDFDFFRTPVLISLKRLLRESPARDVLGVVKKRIPFPRVTA